MNLGRFFLFTWDNHSRGLIHKTVYRIHLWAWGDNNKSKNIYWKLAVCMYSQCSKSFIWFSLKFITANSLQKCNYCPRFKRWYKWMNTKSTLYSPVPCWATITHPSFLHWATHYSCSAWPCLYVSFPDALHSTFNLHHFLWGRETYWSKLEKEMRSRIHLLLSQKVANLH